MKKISFILISLLILNLVIINLVLAQESPIDIGKLNPETGLPEGVPSDLAGVQEIAKTKWDYLGKEWQKILLKNPVVSKIDSALAKVSFVFVILFGMPYSLSLTLLVIIILWFFFFFKFAEIFKNFSAFSESASWVISLALVIFMAQTKVLQKITEWLGWLVFAKKEWWWNLSMIILLVFLFILFYKLSSAYAKKIKEQKEEIEKQQEKMDRKILHETTKGIVHGIEGVD
ncbi:MAG: hypothetical protein KJ559_03235 [Nanoarchaeota archaeon]|nr:hypothetical protein [Nanoarchaeota archaeon]